MHCYDNVLFKVEEHNMKIVVAMDSFKGSMTSLQAGAACKAGILKAMDADVVV